MFQLLVATNQTSAQDFWWGFFCECNAIRVALGVPEYVVLAPSRTPSTAFLNSFGRLRREMLLKKRKSTAEWERLRRQLSATRRATGDNRSGSGGGDEGEAALNVEDTDIELGDLNLDLDGQIGDHLARHRPSQLGKPPRRNLGFR